eukprot:Tamp_24699.p3 GENE.Tamp_24699~~Tamp_24699.p3  ORF type:complete len:108 (+),score=5.34 Tamp_24699:390-713(+)
MRFRCCVSREGEGTAASAAMGRVQPREAAWGGGGQTVFLEMISLSLSLSLSHTHTHTRTHTHTHALSLSLPPFFSPPSLAHLEISLHPHSLHPQDTAQKYRDNTTVH